MSEVMDGATRELPNRQRSSELVYVRSSVAAGKAKRRTLDKESHEMYIRIRILGEK